MGFDSGGTSGRVQRHLDSASKWIGFEKERAELEALPRFRQERHDNARKNVVINRMINSSRGRTRELMQVDARIALGMTHVPPDCMRSVPRPPK